MISALIPAYNESDRIPATILAVRGLSVVDEIIVVDDGSQDDTAQQAEAAGADVVFRQKNQGKGGALNTAFQLSRGDIVLLLDADLGDSAGEADKLLAPLLNGEADMTIAKFPVIPGKGGGKGLVVKLARWGIHTLGGQQMTTPLSGQRAVRRNVIETCGGFESGWGAEVALTVEALRHGFRVQEVETNMTHRVTGRDAASIRHRASQFVGAARTLARLALRRGAKHG